MSLVDTIKNTFVPIHHEGHKFIVAFSALSVVLGFLWMPLFWLGLILTAWCAYFFRDPERQVPQDEDWALSPADGQVSLITMTPPPPELGLSDAPMLKVSIFMNVFNCHVNRAPMRGRVEHIAYREGKFLSADLDKASDDNERNGLIHGRFSQIGMSRVGRPPSNPPCAQHQRCKDQDGSRYLFCFRHWRWSLAV